MQGAGIAIRSLQGYPGELVQSSGMDITLDDVLMILDECYNNAKVLDALNQELFQLWVVDKETMSDWGICLSRHLQDLAASQVIKSNGSISEGGSSGEDIPRLPKGCQGG